MSNSLNSLNDLLLLEKKELIKSFTFNQKFFDYILYLVEDHTCYEIRMIGLECLCQVIFYLKSLNKNLIQNNFKM